MRTQSVLAVGFERLLRTYHITSPQYNILRILRGSKGRGLPSLEIATRMITCVPDITRLIDRLEKAGYVQRQRCTEDRRVVYTGITKPGRKLLTKLDRPVRDAEKATLGHMSKKELAELVRLLTKARQNAETTTA